MKAAAITYKPVGMLLGTAGGLAAGALFKQLWKVLGDQEDAPDATDEERTWREVLIAAAIQGAVFALVRAAVDRAGATTVRKVTGTWPD
ncbi:DUF4235 domain-containing protein [Streptomyces sp. NPDC086023]|uniref:DUF4235 domain-containing protein n=1 Tax=Streptomyces sp. NPDC086023 TaxID=3365746 RepID=UPI0037D23547